MGKHKYRFRNLDWHNLTATDFAWIHMKAALAVMLWVPMATGPTLQQNLTMQILLAWLLVTVIGFFISLWGLFTGAQHDSRRRQGFKLEMVGLWLLMAGPLVFMALQVGLWITDMGTGVPTNRGLAIMFPYVVAAALFCRITMVRTALKSSLYRFPNEVSEENKTDE